MGFIYIPGPFIEVDPSALKKNGTNTPTALMSWGNQDLVDVKKLGIGVSSVGSHDYLRIENSGAAADHLRIYVKSNTIDKQTSINFDSDLTTPGYALGGAVGRWDGAIVARVDLARSDDVAAAGPGNLKDEGYIAFSVKKTTKARKVVLKLDEVGSLVFQNEADYDTDLLWLGIGDIGNVAGDSPTDIFFTGNLNGIPAADFDTLTDSSNADALHVHNYSTVANLNDLGDVNAAAPGDGDSLTWDNGTSKWVPVAGGGATGDVVGPAASTDEAIARFDLATGKLLQNSTATLSDSAIMTFPAAGEVNFPTNNVAIRWTNAGDDAVIRTTSNAITFYPFKTTPVLTLGKWSSSFAQHWLASSNNSYDLGNTSVRWRKAWVYQGFDVASAQSPEGKFYTSDVNGHLSLLTMGSNANATDKEIATVRGLWDTTYVAAINFVSGDDTVKKDDGYIVFETSEGGVSAERMRIEQDGVVTVQPDGSNVRFKVEDALVTSLIDMAVNEDLNVLKNLTVDGQAYSTQDTETQAISAVHTIDWNDSNSTVWDLQPANGNITLTLTNPYAGATYNIKIIQSSTARTISWPAAVLWPGGNPPTISIADDAIDLISLYYDGTNYLATFNQAFA